MTIITIFFVLSGIALCIFVYVDTKTHKQTMPIMEIVWPLTMLWASWIGLIAYFSFGRQKTQIKPKNMDKDMNMEGMSMDMGGMNMGHTTKHKWQGVALSTLHCGAGCVLADLIGETIAGVLGLTLIVGWTLDFILALIFGVYFQYMAIQQMGGVRLKLAINRAIKSDLLSLTAWQVGMYGLMGIYIFGITDGGISRLSFEFWFVMQLAMMAGFIFSYPMNIFLIKKGFKHAM